MGKKGVNTHVFPPQWGKKGEKPIFTDFSQNPSDPSPTTLFLFCLRVIWDRTEHTYIDSKTISIDNTTYPIIITNRI